MPVCQKDEWMKADTNKQHPSNTKESHKMVLNTFRFHVRGPCRSGGSELRMEAIMAPSVITN